MDVIKVTKYTNQRIINKVNFYFVLIFINILPWIFLFLFRILVHPQGDIAEFLIDLVLLELISFLLVILTNVFLIKKDKSVFYRRKKYLLFFLNLPTIIFFSISQIGGISPFYGLSFYLLESFTHINESLLEAIPYLISTFFNIIIWYLIT